LFVIVQEAKREDKMEKFRLPVVTHHTGSSSTSLISMTFDNHTVLRHISCYQKVPGAWLSGMAELIIQRTSNFTGNLPHVVWGRITKS